MSGAAMSGGGGIAPTMRMHGGCRRADARCQRRIPEGRIKSDRNGRRLGCGRGVVGRWSRDGKVNELTMDLLGTTIKDN